MDHQYKQRMPKRDASIYAYDEDENRSSKKGKSTSISDAETEPNTQLIKLTTGLMSFTDMNRDVSALIAMYTQPFFGECLGPEVKINGVDLLSVPIGNYVKTLSLYLNDCVTCDIEIIPLIIQYTTMTMGERSFLQKLFDVDFRVFRNVIYFYDRYEQNVIGFLRVGDTDPFEFMFDNSLDVHHDLNRGIINSHVSNYHDRCVIDAPVESNQISKCPKVTIVSDPTDTLSDERINFPVGRPYKWSNFNFLKCILEGSSYGFTVINRINGKKVNISFPDLLYTTTISSMVFEPSENRFVQMVMHENGPATFREVIIDYDSSKASFKTLKSGDNDIRLIAKWWRWWSYRGVLLGYDDQQSIFIVISIFGDTVSCLTFPKASFTQHMSTSFTSSVLCGRWLVEITNLEKHISIRRFSLDLRVLS